MTANPPKKRKRKTFKRRMKDLSRGPIAVWVLAKLASWYLKLVVKTNKFIVEPADALENVKKQQPVIVSVWHGQHILMPALPFGLHASAMISRNFDGEVTARIVEYFGNRTIRASGGRNQKETLKKGGMVGFLEMLKAVNGGDNVVQTADVPHGTARRAGLGIIMLAQRSGVPIVPLAIASSKRKVFDRSWDKTSFNLPFGTTGICTGEMIHVPSNSDDEALENFRQLLEAEMKRITEKAYALTGNPE